MTTDQDERALDSQLTAWAARGLITPDQAAAIAAHEHAEHPGGSGPGRSSLVVEGLGYVGGVITVVAVALLAGQLWPEFGTGARLSIVAAVVLLLLAGGAAVPEHGAPAGPRLRAVLWTGAVAGTAGFLSVLSADLLELDVERAALLVSAGAAIEAVALWRLHPVLLQHLVAHVAIAVTGAALVAQASDGALVGLGVWTVGVVWLVLVEAGVLPQHRFGVAMGAASAAVGAIMTSSTDAGTAFALVTTVAVVGGALALRDLLQLCIGAAGLLVVLPAGVQRWFGGSLAAPVALLVVGALVIVAAISIARRGQQAPPPALVKRGRLDPRVAILLATATVVGAAILVVVLTA